MNRKTRIHNSSLVPLIMATPNLSKDILSFTRMFLSFDGNMEKKERMYLPMIKDNDFM